ncbi:2824_t:CDS:2 [Acaulospora morrowiae]|uniref:2824_t:CDS:1 n=1 Tax=Acaulospora morrowiae TaxID=94023 RepID=A0A9N9DDA4_9GLOM|nr:2824_t:CDS:2 [Acaulospora morrowiae]
MKRLNYCHKGTHKERPRNTQGTYKERPRNTQGTRTHTHPMHEQNARNGTHREKESKRNVTPTTPSVGCETPPFTVQKAKDDKPVAKEELQIRIVPYYL